MDNKPPLQDPDRNDSTPQLNASAQPEKNSYASKKSNSRFYYIAALVSVLVVVIVVGAVQTTHNVKKNGSALNTAPISKISLATVSITSAGFKPATIVIKPGQAVVWTNLDASVNGAHEVAADPYPLDNGIPGFNNNTVLLKGDSFDFIFDKPGTYHYHDQLNPIKLLGTVIVN